jgi:hypothetical protein
MVVREDVLDSDSCGLEQLFVDASKKEPGEFWHCSCDETSREGFRAVLSENRQEVCGEIAKRVFLCKAANIDGACQ